MWGRKAAEIKGVEHYDFDKLAKKWYVLGSAIGSYFFEETGKGETK